jgi:hypothetical protein
MTLAGPALAPESDYVERVTRRRLRRVQKAAREAASRDRAGAYALNKRAAELERDRGRLLRSSLRRLARTSVNDLDALEAAFDVVKRVMDQ